MKIWVRQYKVNLIERLNPEWLDLSFDMSEKTLFDLRRRGENTPE